MPALVWVVVAAGLLAGEVLTLNLVLLMLSAAALVAAAVALTDAGLAVELLAFAGASTALLLFVRPIAQRHLRSPGGTVDTPRALEGRVAVVVEDVTDDAGQVRVHGEIWRARAYAGGPDLPAGTSVVVAQVEGATLHVYAEDPS